jgi:hypothetical protein
MREFLVCAHQQILLPSNLGREDERAVQHAWQIRQRCIIFRLRKRIGISHLETPRRAARVCDS